MGNCVINLPSITAGRYMIVKDIGSASIASTITINAQAGQTFDASGIGTYIISTPASSLSLVGNGTIWFII